MLSTSDRFLLKELILGFSISDSLPSHVPQILINREPLSHMNFDVELLGDCDCIISELCKRLGQGWSRLSSNSPTLHEIRRTDLATPLSLSTSASHGDTLTGRHHDSHTDNSALRTDSAGGIVSPGTGTTTGNTQVSQAAETVSQAAETESQAVETGSQAVETGSKAVETGSQAVETGSQADNTTGVSRVADTASVSDSDGKTSVRDGHSTKSPEMENKASSRTVPVKADPLCKEETAATTSYSKPDAHADNFSITVTLDLKSDVHVGDVSTRVTFPSKPEAHVDDVSTGVTSPSKPEAHVDDLSNEEEKELYGALDTSLHEMRKLWQIHERQSIAKRLKGT